MLQMIRSLPQLPQPKRIRIKFSKSGDLIYISHLDLVRTMTRAIIRARVPVKYTEGYNPIPKLIFATPLSVGCASECEFLDIKIDREMPIAQIKDHLSASMPQGISILDVYEPTGKFTEAVYSTYEIIIRDPVIDSTFSDIVIAEFDKKELIITKRSKSGDKEVDILPYIKSIECTACNGEIRISTKLCVSSADYLNPEYIATIAYNAVGISKDNYGADCGYTIVRKQLYLADTVSEFK